MNSSSAIGYGEASVLKATASGGLSIEKRGPDLVTATDNIEQALDRIAKLADCFDDGIQRLGGPAETEGAASNPEPVPQSLSARLSYGGMRAHRLAAQLENTLRRLNGLI